MELLIFILLLLTISKQTICQTWNYEELGPDVWTDLNPACNGHTQSPINIRTACTSYQSFTPFQFTSNYNLTYNFTLQNNGHTIVGTYDVNGASPFTLTGGGLSGTYQFRSFHFHWGENYRSGSEHQINGMKYAGEIHFVHINPLTNKIAVLGVFMDSTPNTTLNTTTTTTTTHQRKKRDVYKTDNTTIEEWKKYFASAANLRQINNSTMLSLNLGLLMGNNLNDFWRYQGSLTTPPCTEDVTWTVFKVPTIFTENELESFRTNILLKDYRGPQPLYNRVVYRNFVNETLSSIPDYQCCQTSSSNSVKTLFSLDFLFKQRLYYIFLFISILFINY